MEKTVHFKVLPIVVLEEKLFKTFNSVGTYA